MRIHYMSDLHLEFGQGDLKRWEPPEADVTVLAGDIATGKAGITWAIEKFEGRPVIYVPGNHEYYGGRDLIHHTQDMIDRAKGSNVHVLAPGAEEIGGVVFIGATLWTDYALFGDVGTNKVIAFNTMNDFMQTTCNDKPMKPQDVLDAHMREREYIERALSLAGNLKKVVVTHHAPHAMMLSKRFVHDHPMNPCYASNLQEIMEKHEPELWISGHCHDSRNEQIGKTHLVRNTRGYLGYETDEGFDKNAIVEI